MSNCEIFGIKNIDQDFCMKNKLLKGRYSSCSTCDRAAGVERIPTKQQTAPRNNKGKKNLKGNKIYNFHHVVDISRVRQIGKEQTSKLSHKELQILKRLESISEDQFIVKSL